MPIPFGWYFVGYSDELKSGEIRSVHYFGEDLVLFRTESGAAGLLEAYCPHLGAHLGDGRIDGESLRCPFHEWAFNPAGACTDVPYAKRIPPRAANAGCMRSYPISEKNQVIWAWYHPHNEAPFFDVVEYEEMASADWSKQQRFEWKFNSHPQEISENAVDVAHFKYIHKMEGVPEGETTIDGHQRLTVADGERKYVDPQTGVERVVRSRVESVQNGAGQKLARFSGVVDLVAMTLVTPIEADQCEVRMAFSHKNMPEDAPAFQAAQMTIKLICGQTGIEGDIPIWNRKIYRANPILCDGDGQIMRYRKYFAQFYAEDFAADTAAQSSSVSKSGTS
ncbi:MAG TPA: Rieske 2Fe-2S domain-containing protein [Spongiibacteraceae bacterium]|nr:Rieske 2Fe-2S domain-containing protein [Spongiibacteraceae bacterium]